MLVRISASPPGPLSVIDSLPDARLAILEGYNGIGKTLAVRVLQLCTGTMPYPLDSAAWESLREGLGSIEVEISHLEGADRITWVADSANWEPGDGPVPRTEWFESITIDGESASLDDVRRLIAVIRLGGDEELTDTFASQAEAYATTVQRWTAKHAASERGPLKQLEDLAGTTGDLLASVSVAMLAQMKLDVHTAEQQLAHLRELVGKLQKRRNEVNEALNLQRRVSEMHTRGPELQHELAEIDKLIVKSRSQLEAAQQEVTLLAAQVGRTASLDKELINAERTLHRNIDNLAAAWSRAGAQAAALDIDSHADAAEKLLDELTQLEEQLADQYQEQYQAPVMMQLLGTLTGELRNAESRGLGDQVAVDDADSGKQLSVSQTRVGMAIRHDYLEQQPPPPKAVEISQELKRVTDHKAQVESLLKTLDDVERFARLVNRNEDRVHKALQEGAGGEAAKALESANKLRSECNQALLTLATKRAALAQKLGTAGTGMSQQALTQQLKGVLESLDIPEEHLGSESIEVEDRFAQAEAQLAEANVRASDYRQRLAHEKATIRNAVELLDSDPDLAWVRQALNLKELISSGNIDHLHRGLVAAQDIIQGVLDRLGDHRNQLGAVETALHATARELRGQNANAIEYVEQLQTWLASSFSDWFNDARVRRELLKDADEGHEIMVDLATRRVSWSENQVRRSRPLEAFSSGEQAFAYTRARLAMLDDPLTVENRLIVLDEFGAFIAEHLQRGMIDYLKDWTSDRQRDRVLLILPLSRDYTQMAEEAVGDRAKGYATLARHVNDHGYAVRTMVR